MNKSFNVKTGMKISGKKDGNFISSRECVALGKKDVYCFKI